MKILIEVPAGELIDKITILEIKIKQMHDPHKLLHVQDELRELTAVRDREIPSSSGLDKLAEDLAQVNLLLWRVEDRLREAEQRNDFNHDFIELARSVYHLNDRRAAIKRSINEVTGSRLIEEKSYADYQAA